MVGQESASFVVHSFGIRAERAGATDHGAAPGVGAALPSTRGTTRNCNLTTRRWAPVNANVRAQRSPNKSSLPQEKPP
jgi:hypothetical protein